MPEAHGDPAAHAETAAHAGAAAPLIVVNPSAARLHDASIRRDLVARVAAAVQARIGVPPRIVEGGIEAARAALAAPTTPPLVAVVGGDGTIREAAAALAGRPIPLAIVPAGTGNVLAGALRIRGIGSAEAAIRHGTPRTIDVGMARWGSPGSPAAVGESVFLVACGMGLDARIMAAAQHEWKRRLRFGAYVGATLHELTRLTPADFTMTVDDDLLTVRGLLVLVANAGEIVPGRIGPRQPIDASDGYLDLIVLGGGHPVAAARGAIELMLRTGAVEGSVIRRLVRTVRVEAHPAQPIQTDGDPHPPGWIDARILPAALTVLVPPR